MPQKQHGRTAPRGVSGVDRRASGRSKSVPRYGTRNSWCSDQTTARHAASHPREHLGVSPHALATSLETLPHASVALRDAVSEAPLHSARHRPQRSLVPTSPRAVGYSALRPRREPSESRSSWRLDPWDATIFGLVLDSDIRMALAAMLRAEHRDAAENRLWSEFSVLLGAARVDLCLVNGALSGWEIKSPRDNLDRLAGQVRSYNQVLDYVSIVASTRDLARVRDRVPKWWGIVEAIETPDGVALRPRRMARRNKNIDALSVAQLLWREEAVQELVSRGIQRRWAKATRWDVWDALVETLTLDELRSVVRHRLRARPPREADRLYMPDGVTLLSPAT